MTTIVPRTWIPGTPRGYGNAKVASEWLTELAEVLEKHRGVGDTHDEATRYEVHLEFRINPDSGRYYGQMRPHGSDLDNLVKQTIDGLSHTLSKSLPPGLGIMRTDSAIYRIVASKEHVTNDAEMGVWVTVSGD